MRTVAKSAGSKRKSETNALGQKLLESARQALQAATTGDLSGITVREVEIAEPGQYGPREVKALRQAMGASQRVFAELLGVSKELAAQWEYGIRRPAPLARRLMDKVREDPAAFTASLVKRRDIMTGRKRGGRTGSPSNPTGQSGPHSARASVSD
jgi:DNA-binding transcriptional regulator YiaG